eukprot:29936-Pelagococcus_subviridis.AAC.1
MICATLRSSASTIATISSASPCTTSATTLSPFCTESLNTPGEGMPHCCMRCSGNAPRTLPSVLTRRRPPLPTKTSSSALIPPGGNDTNGDA